MGKGLSKFALAAFFVSALVTHAVMTHAALSKNADKIFYLVLCSGTSSGDIAEAGPAAKNITDMTSRGASAMLSMRAIGRLSLANVYFSLNTSNYTKCRRGCNLGFNASEPVDETTSALTRFATSTGIMPAPYNVLNLFRSVKPITRNVSYLYPGQPGLLGSALAQAGVPVYVFGNGDFNGLKGYNTRREISLAGMSTSGETTFGDVSPAILKKRNDFPLKLSIDDSVVIKNISSITHGPALVILELSDIQRLEAITSSQNLRKFLGSDTNPDFEKAWYLTTLSRSDGMLGDILSLARRNGGAVMFALIGSSRRDGFVALDGPGVPSGVLTSRTTHRRGFITLLDIAPTILDFYGIEQPEKMYGKAITGIPAPGESTLPNIAVKSSNLWLVDFRVRPIFTNVYCIVTASLMLLFALLPAARRTAAASKLRFLVYLVYLMPIATCVPSFFPHDSFLKVFLISIGCAVFFSLLLGLASRHNWDAPIYVIALAISLALIADLFTGVRMPLNSVFGYSTHYAGRFYGIGNIQMAQLIEASVLVVAALGYLLKFGPAAYAAAAAAAGFLCCIAMAPGLGTNFGGIITAFITFALFINFLLGRGFSFKTLALLGLLLAVCVAALVLSLKLIPAMSQSHFGMFFGKLLGGDKSYVLAILKGKAKLLFTSLLGFEWVALVVVIMFSAVTVYGRNFKLIREIFASRPAMYAAGRALFLGGFAGVIFNDSGISVAANMWIFWPFAMFLILASPKKEVNEQEQPEADTADIAAPENPAE